MLKIIEIKMKNLLVKLRKDYNEASNRIQWADGKKFPEIMAARTLCQEQLQLLVPLNRYLRNYLQPNQSERSRAYWVKLYSNRYADLVRLLSSKISCGNGAPMLYELNEVRLALPFEGGLLPGLTVTELWSEVEGDIKRKRREVQNKRKLSQELRQEFKKSLQPEQLRMLTALSSMDDTMRISALL